MHIAVSTPTFFPVVGGAEVGIHEIYRRIGVRHRVTIVTPRHRALAIELYGGAEPTSVPYTVRHTVPWVDRRLHGKPSNALNRTSAPYMATLGALAVEDRPDVVNFHFVQPHGAALIATRRLWRIPTVLSLIGRTDVITQQSGVRRRLSDAVVRSSNAVLPITEYCTAGPAARGREEVIPYGVDVNAFAPHAREVELRKRLGIRDDDVVVVCVQRLAAVKRVDVLVQVMAALREAETTESGRVVLLVVGKGPEASALAGLVRELDLEDRVILAGFVAEEDLPRYMASSDIFAFHSMFETFGVVFAQAMACGLPVVAANTSSVSCVVRPETGGLVTPFAVDEFATALRRLAQNPDLRRRIGQQNREEAVRRYDWDVIASRYEEALIRVVGPGEQR